VDNVQIWCGSQRRTGLAPIWRVAPRCLGILCGKNRPKEVCGGWNAFGGGRTKSVDTDVRFRGGCPGIEIGNGLGTGKGGKNSSENCDEKTVWAGKIAPRNAWGPHSVTSKAIEGRGTAERDEIIYFSGMGKMMPAGRDYTLGLA